MEHGPEGLEAVPYRFTGKELDAETGLYYYGARYFNPRTSRWISADPELQKYLPERPVDEEARRRNQNLPGIGGVFNSVNLSVYHYAVNNPIKSVDPTGEFTIELMGSMQVSIFGCRFSISIEARYLRNSNPSDESKNAVLISLTGSDSSYFEYRRTQREGIDRTRWFGDEESTNVGEWTEFSMGLEADIGFNLVVGNAEEPEQLLGPGKVTAIAGGWGAGTAIHISEPDAENSKGQPIRELAVSVPPIPGLIYGGEVHAKSDTFTQELWSKEW